MQKQKGQLNPYIEGHLHELDKKANLDTRRHKFSVHGLYMWGKPIKEEAYDSAKKYCKQNHIEFVLRDFFNGMPEDREMVERLPAFHVYYEEEYMKTFYEGDEVESILQEIIENIKSEKKNTWTNAFLGWMPFRFTVSMPTIRPSSRRILTSTDLTRN
jgi:hypothetical protein